MIRIAFLSVALLLPLGAHAQDDAYGLENFQVRQPGVSPLNHYLANSTGSLLLCSLVFKARNIEDNALKDPDKPPKPKLDYRVCVERHRMAIKVLYDSAMGSVKSSAVKAAVKEHFILVVSALQGIYPQDNERVIDYERRTNAEKRAVDQQRIRVEAEL